MSIDRLHATAIAHALCCLTRPEAESFSPTSTMMSRLESTIFFTFGNNARTIFRELGRRVERQTKGNPMASSLSLNQKPINCIGDCNRMVATKSE